ncbi:SDR family NAD(P)-dependent oxidoreductase [Cohnella abietis]|uniref:Short-chain dehydrogenase/reductase n=1 Tax=Cohnella abietis TaxID=2507935 RepID=A0A3T1DB13_9BACL|nr:SDR family NAD(P)-dependent oxidoreductase [Cohnella abietis]BBI35224.1 short-chain dehydrogenase/reductase [Cohnella abietis]
MSKTVLITGTSTGFGKELALQFAKREWNVVATMRNTTKADPELIKYSNVNVVALDITNPEMVTQVIEDATTQYGRIDVLINNAGYCQMGTFEEVSLAQVREQYETNVFGVVSVIQAVLPQMRQHRAGHIINISSMGGVQSLPTIPIYCSSKAALENMSDGLASEVKALGIDITLVEPAGFKTGFQANTLEITSKIPDYQASYDWWNGLAENAPYGNLERAMSAVADIAGTENPPRRLALGSMGLVMARTQLNSMLEEYEKWEHITASAD